MDNANGHITMKVDKMAKKGKGSKKGGKGGCK